MPKKEAEIELVSLFRWYEHDTNSISNKATKIN